MATWGAFALAALCGLVIVYAPGYLLLRAFHFARATSFAAAPLASLFCYPIICVVNEAVGIPSSWATVFAPLLAMSAMALAVSVAVARRRGTTLAAVATIDLGMGKGAELPTGRLVPNAALFALSAGIGIAVGIYVFASRIESPDAIFQWVDNIHHLGQVQSYLDSGFWSPLSSSLYDGPDDAAFDPYGGYTAFYPSTWHCVVAMMVQMAHASVPVATNASTMVFSCVVFPVSMCAFVRMLFPTSAGTAALAALCTSVCSVFPWGFVTAGPLYPNLVGTACVPALAAAFVAIFEAGRTGRRGARRAALALSVAGLIAIAFAHPNTPFTFAVIIAPFFVLRLMEFVDRFGFDGAGGKVVKALVVVLLVEVVCLIWYLLFTAPFLHSVVSYDWPAFKSAPTAIVDVLCANYRETTHNFLFGIFTVAGIVRAVMCGKRRWLIASFLFAAAIYVVAATSTGMIKQLLAGFWYTDFYRIGATVFLAAVPLAAYGMAGAVRLAAHAWERVQGARGRAAVNGAGRVVGAESAASPDASSRCAMSGKKVLPAAHDANDAVVAKTAVTFAVLVALASVFLWFVPIRPFLNFLDIDTRTHPTIVYDRVTERFHYGSSAIYNGDERAFVQEALSIIGPDAIVINEPNDGTMFAYGADGLRVVYRFAAPTGMTDEATLVRTHLDEISENEDVRRAVASMGAEYVIQLDHGDVDREERYLSEYNRHDWEGVDDIDDDTPGFELVLARDDMRLYRIVG